MMQEELFEKVLKYETFLNDKLKPDLKLVLEERDKIYSEIALFLTLKNSIHAIQASELKPGQPLKTKIDLGCNFYCQAEATNPTTIFVEIGLGFYAEFTLSEALEHVRKTVKRLENKAEEYTKESSKIKANIKLVLRGLSELQNIRPTEK